MPILVEQAEILIVGPAAFKAFAKPIDLRFRKGHNEVVAGSGRDSVNLIQMTRINLRRRTVLMVRGKYTFA